MFSHFSRTPTCDGQTDGHRAMASTADAQHRAVIKVNHSIKVTENQQLKRNHDYIQHYSTSNSDINTVSS